MAQLGRIGVMTSKPLVYARPTVTSRNRSPWSAHGSGSTLPEAPDVMMIGDRSHDLEAGRTHGTATLGVTWGSVALRS